MEKSKKRRRITILVVVLVNILVLIAGMTGGFLAYVNQCDPATNYSEAEHLERISKLVEKHYIGSDSKYATTTNGTIFDRASEKYENIDDPYTGFTVNLLYDENDHFTYWCIVEFEPCGYLYVKIWDERVGHSMYTRFSGTTKVPWKRRRIRNNGEAPPPYNGHQWIHELNTVGLVMDENIFYEAKDGEIITYTDSHFRAANISGTEKRYLLSIEGSEGLIPAVKRGDKYLNLISMEEFEYSPNLMAKDHPYTRFSPPPKRFGDL